MTMRGTFICAAVGLIAGGAGLLAGVLTAPASGRETRRVWLRRAEEEMDALERKGRRAIEEATREAQQFVDERTERAKQAVAGLVGD